MTTKDAADEVEPTIYAEDGPPYWVPPAMWPLISALPEPTDPAETS